MTKHVDTAFERHFSEPPVVTVKADRTHCEACKEPLDPSVMHKCEGNKEYQPAPVSHTEITEMCPDCGSAPVLVQRREFSPPSYVFVCRSCRTFVASESVSAADAIYGWNLMARLKQPHIGNWPKWRAHLLGDDERANVIPSEAKPTRPDLSGYRGACPLTHVEGQPCHLCEDTGVVPPTKPEGAR